MTSTIYYGVINATEQIVAKYGKSVLIEERFVNILADLYPDRDNPAIFRIIKSAIKEGVIKELVSSTVNTIDHIVANSFYFVTNIFQLAYDVVDNLFNDARLAVVRPVSVVLATKVIGGEQFRKRHERAVLPLGIGEDGGFHLVQRVLRERIDVPLALIRVVNEPTTRFGRCKHGYTPSSLATNCTSGSIVSALKSNLMLAAANSSFTGRLAPSASAAKRSLIAFFGSFL